MKLESPSDFVIFDAIRNAKPTNTVLCDLLKVYKPTNMDILNAIRARNFHAIKTLLENGCEVYIYSVIEAVSLGDLRIIMLFEERGWDVFSYIPQNLLQNPDTLHYYLENCPDRVYKTFKKREKCIQLKLTVPFASRVELSVAFPGEYEDSDTKRLQSIKEKIAIRKLKEHINCEYLVKNFQKNQLKSYVELFGKVETLGVNQDVRL